MPNSNEIVNPMLQWPKWRLVVAETNRNQGFIEFKRISAHPGYELLGLGLTAKHLKQNPGTPTPKASNVNIVGTKPL